MENILESIKELDVHILRLIISMDGGSDGLRTIPTTQVRIISYIFNNEGDVYQKDLEKSLNLRRATLSGILNTMEKNGLLVRVPSDDDARSKKIVLMDNTKSIFIKMRKKMIAATNIITRGISDDELKLFLNVIDKMKENIGKECDYNVEID